MENNQDYPPMDHILTSVETTEQYLSKNSIQFKVSQLLAKYIFIDFETSSNNDKC